MCRCRRLRKTLGAILGLLILIPLLQLIPSGAYGVELPEGSPLSPDPPLAQEPGYPDLPPAIRELCRAMEFHDFPRWYQLLSDESREGRTEEEFVVQHQKLLKQTIASLEGRFNMPFMVRTEVTIERYPKFYIGRFTVIYFSAHSFRQGWVLYETGVDIAFEVEPDGRVTTRFGGYGGTVWTNKLTILPPGSL